MEDSDSRPQGHASLEDAQLHLERLAAFASRPDLAPRALRCHVHLSDSEDAGDPDLAYMLDDISDLRSFGIRAQD